MALNVRLVAPRPRGRQPYVRCVRVFLCASAAVFVMVVSLLLMLYVTLTINGVVLDMAILEVVDGPRPRRHDAHVGWVYVAHTGDGRDGFGRSRFWINSVSMVLQIREHMSWEIGCAWERGGWVTCVIVWDGIRDPGDESMMLRQSWSGGLLVS